MQSAMMETSHCVFIDGIFFMLLVDKKEGKREKGKKKKKEKRERAHNPLPHSPGRPLSWSNSGPASASCWPAVGASCWWQLSVASGEQEVAVGSEVIQLGSVANVGQWITAGALLLGLKSTAAQD